MDLTTITVQQFQAQFPRDFPYSPLQSDSPVYDSDIQRAFLEAQMVFNQSFFSTDAQITLAYLYLTAHYLCNDLRAASAGANSSGAFPVSSRSVGSVSESYEIPKAYSDSPVLAQYTTSLYGMKYLSFVLPQLIGNMTPVQGGVAPGSDYVPGYNFIWGG